MLQQVDTFFHIIYGNPGLVDLGSDNKFGQLTIILGRIRLEGPVLIGFEVLRNL